MPVASMRIAGAAVCVVGSCETQGAVYRLPAQSEGAPMPSTVRGGRSLLRAAYASRLRIQRVVAGVARMPYS